MLSATHGLTATINRQYQYSSGSMILSGWVIRPKKHVTIILVGFKILLFVPTDFTVTVLTGSCDEYLCAAMQLLTRSAWLT